MRRGLGLAALLLALAPGVVRAQRHEVVRVPMRDGTELATDVWWPEGDDTPRPVLLRRTPYGRALDPAVVTGLLSAGYTVASQDVRGRGASDGIFSPFRSDAHDGADTIAWVAAQPWSNGRVGTFGGSAERIVQLLAAGEAPDALRCVHAMVATDDVHEGLYPGGAWRTELGTAWLEGLGAPDALAEFRAYEAQDAFWASARLDASERSRVRATVFLVGGFYDIFASGTPRTFRQLAAATPAEPREGPYLILGPWTHGGVGVANQGELTYPADAAYQAYLPELAAFFEWCLRDGPRPTWAPVRYYVSELADDGRAATGEWRDATGWPPPAAPVELRLQPDGSLRAAAPPVDGAPVRLPVDPRIGRMIIAAHDEGCVHDVLIIAAALSVQDPRVRPHEKRDAADQAHEQFQVEGSDFLAYLKIWDWYHDQQVKLTRRKLAKVCEKAYLSVRRIDEWREVFRQLRSLCQELGYELKKGHNDEDAVHRALLTGLLANIGSKGEKHEFKGARNSSFMISPGSSLFSAKPKWVMCAEIVRTSKVYARTVAGVDPKWIEDVAAHLIKKTHSDPRWDEKTGRVVADEKVTLYGLDIVPRRTVHYGPIDPALSRELFIHHALIDDQLRSASKALKHNRALIRDIGTLQAKARRNDLIADTQTLYNFYDARLPKDIYASKSFERWVRKAESGDPNALRMTRADVLEFMPEEVTPEAYPDQVSFAGATSKLKYAFEPGRDDDGATIRVSVAALHQLTRQRVDWSVPGLIRPRIEALVRSLPKQLRRQFDANQIAGELAPVVKEDRGSIEAQLAQVLTARTGIAVRPEDFRHDQLESYLFPRIEVIDEHGQALEASRDLGSLQAKFAKEATKVVQQAGADIEKLGMIGWEFDELPKTIEFSRPGSPKVVGFPSLIVEDGKVSLKVLATRWESDQHTRSGLGLLYGLAIKRELRLRVKNLPGYTKLHMLAAACSMADQLETIIWTRVGTIIGVDNKVIPRNKDEFELGLLGAWDRGVDETNRVITNFTQIFESLMRVRGRLDESHPNAWGRAIKDMRGQLGMLIADDAMVIAETRWLWCYARFLRAIEVRLDKLRSIGPERDANAADRVYAWTQCLHELMAQGAHTAEVAEDFWTLRWMVEEFRVASFAQNLRTSIQVSEKRLREQLDRIIHA